jgi:hypothetical protein
MIGMVEVASFNMGTGVPVVTMTSTLSRTNSAAISGKRSVRPSPQRYSILMVRPSTHPSSRSRCTKAAVHALMAEADAGPKNPIIGGVCCAPAASGQTAAAPPRAKMNSRRFMPDIALRFACRYPFTLVSG